MHIIDAKNITECLPLKHSRLYSDHKNLKFDLIAQEKPTSCEKTLRMKHVLKLCHARCLSSPCFRVCFCNVLLHLIIALIIHVLLSKEISNIHYHKRTAQKEINKSAQTRPVNISYLHQLHKTR